MNTINILKTRIERFDAAIRQLESIRDVLCDDRANNVPSFLAGNGSIPIAGIARNKLIQGITNDIMDLQMQIDAMNIHITKINSNEEDYHTNP